MATTREILAKCKNGELEAATELSRMDMEKYPQYPWPKSNMGWVLYYKVKKDVESHDKNQLVTDISEIEGLGLSKDTDAMMLGNLASKIASYMQNLSGDETEILSTASVLFSKIKDIDFGVSQGFSYLLSVMLHLKTWPLLQDFIEWWNIDRLRDEDYQEYKTANGRSVMSLTERVYNAYTTCLLKSHNTEKIHDFLPKLEVLVNTHHEMKYPSFCYVKLLMEINTDKQTILASYIPFARRKSSEFWVWDRMSDIVSEDKDLQLACLLRATTCTRDESFLGPTRIKLAKLYANANDRARAKYQIDIVHQLYLRSGWRVPLDIQAFVHTDWIASTASDSSLPDLDYMTLTNNILYTDTKSCLAIITYIDDVNHRAGIIYGTQERMTIKLKFRARIGNIIKMYYAKDEGGKVKFLNAFKSSTNENLPFAKRIEGKVQKRDGQQYAFLKTPAEDVFISPNLVRDHHLNNGDSIKAVIVYDYNKKKENWNWVVLTIKK